MAVPVKQTVKINFAGGLDTKTDPKQVPPANFLALTNSVFTTGGQLTKRNGFKSLGNSVTSNYNVTAYSNLTGTISSAKKVFSYNDELLVNDAWNLYSYDANQDAWNYKGRSTLVDLTTTPIVQNANYYACADEAVDLVNNVRISAFTQQTSGSNYYTYYSVQDIATGQVIYNQALLGLGYTRPRVISINGNTWVFAVEIATGNIYGALFQGQTIITPFYNTGLATKAPGLIYDVDYNSATGFINYTFIDRFSHVNLYLLDPTTLTLNYSTRDSSTTGITCCSSFAAGSNTWVVYANATNVKFFVANNSGSQIQTPKNITTITLPATYKVNNVTGVFSNTSNATVFWDLVYISAGSNYVVDANTYFQNIDNAFNVQGFGTLFMGTVFIVSKAFKINEIPHIVCAFSTEQQIFQTPQISGLYTYPNQPTTFLLNLYNYTAAMDTNIVTNANPDAVANIAAKISPGEARPFCVLAGALTSVNYITSNIVQLALGQNSDYTFSATPLGSQNQFTYLAPTGIINCQFDFTYSNPDVQVLGNNAIISNGSVLMYDGASIAEQNFHIFPNAPNVGNISTSGGGMGLVGGTSLYSYCVVYEWIDNQGQIHRSSPSTIQTAFLGNGSGGFYNYTFASFASSATGSVQLTIPNLSVTNKPGNQVTISVYRTAANQNVYYLLQTFGYGNSFGTYLNNTQGEYLTFTDTFADSQIINNIQLYTLGALEYFAPPATKSLTNFKSRAVAIPSEMKTSFYYSNQVLPNFPVQFVPAFLQNVNNAGGSILAVANMDDKLIIFKTGKVVGPSILYMVGNGPAASGTGNDFTDPLPIAVDVGCTDRASIVMTPVGLIFKSNKGIYLLDRNLSASYIGAPVEKYNQYSIISSSLIPNSTQVRFVLSNGTMLMYDYFYQRWGTFDFSALNFPIVSDCIWQGQHTFVTSNGSVYQEVPGQYYDGSLSNQHPILMSFTTSWIKLAELQGYQRSYFFYLLGQYFSDHKLNLSVAYDFSSSPAQTFTITPDPSSSLENWRVFLAQQRCQSFQISLQEVFTGTYGQGFNLSGLNLVLGAKNAFLPQNNATTVG